MEIEIAVIKRRGDLVTFHWARFRVDGCDFAKAVAIILDHSRRGECQREWNHFSRLYRCHFRSTEWASVARMLSAGWKETFFFSVAAISQRWDLSGFWMKYDSIPRFVSLESCTCTYSITISLLERTVRCASAECTLNQQSRKFHLSFYSNNEMPIGRVCSSTFLPTLHVYLFIVSSCFFPLSHFPSMCVCGWAR